MRAVPNNKAHWDEVYTKKAPDEVSWFQRDPRVSLDLIELVAPDRSAAIVDVGGGASRLVDGLVAAGYSDITVLDVSAVALDHARRRLGPAAFQVTWREADLLTAGFEPHSVDVWYDRAVYHFLLSAEDRARYVEQVRRAVKPGGYVLVATFADDGPTSCSGLPVARYAPDALHAKFGRGFRLLQSLREQHVTPSGVQQPFVYCVCRHEPRAREAAA